MNSPYEPLSEARAPGVPGGSEAESGGVPRPRGGTAWQVGAAADVGYAVGGSPRPYPYAGNLPQTPAWSEGWVRSTAGKRLGAALLDGLLAFVTFGIGWLIWSVIAWSDGQTPAKSILGMRCVTEDGRPARWGTMFVRELLGKGLLGAFTCSLTSLISCFMILTEARQGIWDKLASTHVVDVRRT